uniref:Uncharacterized protein n=1 Tax=Anguilla anguilla TaxID=7936 RepID=A0A0E9PDP0_ANGAN
MRSAYYKGTTQSTGPSYGIFHPVVTVYMVKRLNVWSFLCNFYTPETEYPLH